MVAQEMVARGVSIRETAAHLGVDESTLRYHLARTAAVSKRPSEDRTRTYTGWQLPRGPTSGALRQLQALSDGSHG